MSPETNSELLANIDGDILIQSMIAQSNARYILYNTQESRANFPEYSIIDEKLNILAFYYLNIGCRFLESQQTNLGIQPLEKGASILEYTHGSPQESTQLGKYYGLISAMAYYASFQYSKSFILIKKIKSDTIIGRHVSLFLKRDYFTLLTEINELVSDSKYSDNSISESVNETESSKRVYEISIAKVLNTFINYLYTGERKLLESSRRILSSLKEISEIKEEPDICGSFDY